MGGRLEWVAPPDGPASSEQPWLGADAMVTETVVGRWGWTAPDLLCQYASDGQRIKQRHIAAESQRSCTASRFETRWAHCRAQR